MFSLLGRCHGLAFSQKNTGRSNAAAICWCSGNVVGALRYTASTGVAEVNFAQAGGGFLARGRLYLANRVDGSLTSVGWANGAPVAGTATIVSSPASDGADWRTRALFLLAA